ncbi:MAG: hypothetical protein AAFN70_14655 [Planctomycetota bacterium]
MIQQWSDEEAAIRWFQVIPGRRIEEHLSEPTDHDVEWLSCDGVRLEVICSRLSDNARASRRHHRRSTSADQARFQ